METLYLIFLLSIPPQFQEKQISLRGELNNFLFYSESWGIKKPEFAIPGFPDTEPYAEPYLVNFNRLRTDIAFLSPLSLYLTYQAELYWGGNEESIDLVEGALDFFNQGYWILGKTITRENRYLIHHRLYRAFLEAKNQRFKLRVGRQKLDWETTFFFAPTNIFTPRVQARPEPEQIRGMDLVDLVFYFTPFTQLEGVFGPPFRGQERDAYHAALRLKTLLFNWDSSILLGYFVGDTLVGTTFQGNLRNGTLRTEILYSFLNNLQFAIDYDYFIEDIHVLLEYYHNTGETQSFLIQELSKSGHDYLGISLTRELPMLAKLGLNAIFNLTDNSQAILPDFSYSLTQNWVIYLGMIFFLGDEKSQLGSYEDLLNIRINFYF